MRMPRIVIADGQRHLYVKAKLLIGSNWGYLANLKPSAEYREREEIYRIISNLA